MKRRTEDLEQQVFDVAIVGAGISGACVAWDAASRGLSVALVDKDDFGAATSAASSKVLHGGVRYLQRIDLRKVRESALERIHFQNLAPHLTRWVPFLVPSHAGLLEGKLLLRAALRLHELLCAGQHRHLRDPGRAVPPTDFLDRRQARRLLPELDRPDLTGAARFHECHMYSSERMTLAFVQGAATAGATVANYVRAEDFLMEGGRVAGARLTDLETGGELVVRARLVVNAAGPWIPALNRHLPGRDGTPIATAFGKGSHLVSRSLTGDHAVALKSRGQRDSLIDRGGRHVFVIPWRGRSLVGTSYVPFHDDLDEVRPAREEVRWLIDEVNGRLSGNPLSEDDVVWAYAGIYPLVDREADPAVYRGTSEFRIVDHESADGVPGVISAFGAKYTTARLLAERTVDRVVERLGRAPIPCTTRTEPLPSGDIDDMTRFRRARIESHAGLLDEEVVDHLVSAYGAAVDDVIRLVRDDPRLGERIEPDREEILAEVVWATTREMAEHLDDVVYRRTGVGTLGNPSEDGLRRCAELMGEAAGWDPRRRDEEIDRARRRFFS